MFSKITADNKRRIEKSLFILGFIVFVYLFVNVIFVYIAPFVFGFIFSLALRPPVNFINKKFKVHRGVVTLFLIVISFTLIGTLGTKLFSALFVQADEIFKNRNIYINDANNALTSLEDLFNNAMSFVPEEFASFVIGLFENLLNAITKTAGTGFKDGSINIVTKIPNTIMSIILTIISAFFITKDYDLLKDGLTKLSPPWLTDKYSQIKDGLLNAIVGYIKAQLIMMSIIGVIAIFGLTLIKFPYALLIGLTISFVDALPIFGSGFILWPLSAYNLITKNYTLSLQIIIIYVIILVIRQFLEPKVLGDQIGVHPLLTLMSMYAGLKIFGVLGFIIGPMILIVSKVIISSNPVNTKKPEISNGTV